LPAIFPENHSTGSFPGVLPGVARFLKTWLYKQHLARHIPALMTILGINYLNVSITALLVIYVFICLFMILLVLMQRPKQEGLGAAFGASTTDQLFGARTTNVLQKATVYMATLFFVLTLALAILMQKRNKVNSVSAIVKTPDPIVESSKPLTNDSLKEQLNAVIPATTEQPKGEDATKAEDEPKSEDATKAEETTKAEDSPKAGEEPKSAEEPK